MADRYASYSKSIDGTYDRAVTLLPAMGEFEATLAVYVNVSGVLKCVLLGDTAQTTFLFDQNNLGLFKIRVKQVISFNMGDAAPVVDRFTEPYPALVGLY